MNNEVNNEINNDIEDKEKKEYEMEGTENPHEKEILFLLSSSRR